MKIKLVVSAVLLLVLSACHVGRFFIYNFSDIRDYKKFPSRPLAASKTPFHFVDLNLQTAKVPTVNSQQQPIDFEKHLEKNSTVAFLVIRHDTVIYEWYRPHYDSSAIVPSFSMAKSFVSALVGIAIGEGKIKSVNEPITNYLDFKHKDEMSQVTIQHLLDMRSGIKNIENYYNPFGDVAKHYYGRHLKRYVKNLRLRCEPGTEWEYLSVNTQLLGLIVEKATGKHLTDYLQEKLWTPLGMEFNAGWSIDSKKEGTEKAFCCINARARDFAKFGRLYLHKGNWNGTQLVPKDWTEQTAYNYSSINNFLYSGQWWHNRIYMNVADTIKLKEPFVVLPAPKKNMKNVACIAAKDFYADGHLGQFIYVLPQHDIVIVRLGKRPGSEYWPGLMRKVAYMNKL